jgi:NAD+ diphosphatase
MRTYWFIFHQKNLLLAQNADGSHSVPLADEPPVCPAANLFTQQLPSLDGTPAQAFQLSANPPLPAPPNHDWHPLRSTFFLLPRSFYQLAGKASELLYWDRQNSFCGICGTRLERATSISKKCPACEQEIWPNVQPAIIVRIRKPAIFDADGKEQAPEQIMLVHARKFPRPDYYGLVAGFVETGETLEECVCREVMEETHLEIKNLRYFGSQDWPYPLGLMIGFTADYAGGQIRLQDEELTRGAWFSRDAMPHIPDEASIARRMIDDWLRNA